jgi:sec-independent protein translocase protein TatC
MNQKQKRKKNDETPPEHSATDTETTNVLPKQALLVHLKALRNVLVVSVIAIIVAFLAVFLGFSDQIMEFLKAPMTSRGIDLVYIALAESIVMKMKISFIVGAVLASPIVFGQIWAFLKPALYPHEGRVVVSMFFVTVFLFLAGAVFAYFVVFRMAVAFFLINSEGVATAMISVEKYVGFLVSFVLPFGLMFELPVVMSLLTRSGLLTVSTFTKSRKYVIFAIFIVAAILTPPDVVSQVLLAFPLILLYEAGIIVSRITQKKAEKRRAAVGE